MRSLISLSFLCFFLADVRDGLGPFLGVYLQSCGWSADMIGYVMTVGGLFALVFTTALGALADQTHRKRTWLIISIILIVLGCGWLFVDSSVVSATTTHPVKDLFNKAIIIYSSEPSINTIYISCGPKPGKTSPSISPKQDNPVHTDKEEHFGVPFNCFNA